MIYLDTSVLGAVFFREPNAALIFGQVKAARFRGLVISAWTLTAMAVLTRRIAPADAVRLDHWSPTWDVTLKAQAAAIRSLNDA